MGLTYINARLKNNLDTIQLSSKKPMGYVIQVIDGNLEGARVGHRPLTEDRLVNPAWNRCVDAVVTKAQTIHGELYDDGLGGAG